MAINLQVMRFVRAIITLTLALCWAAPAGAVLFSNKEAGGKTITCEQTGLRSNLKDCGVDSDNYAYVFVGKISAVTPLEHDEKEIQIIPEEIFAGKPANPLTVKTSQGACFPDFVVKDRWLFYLHEEKGKPIYLGFYSNPSLPVGEGQEGDAQDQIQTLRRLKKLGDRGILRGHVGGGELEALSGPSVPNARVVARRKSDNKEFITKADSVGGYEFEPLPPGEYAITADYKGTFKSDGTELELKVGACKELTITTKPH